MIVVFPSEGTRELRVSSSILQAAATRIQARKDTNFFP